MGNWRALAILDATSRANQWRALPISLCALKHPLTLASIGLLLLNDHVLKVLMPSPLTGKLSDFAGLFFFPFLLAALLSLPSARSNCLTTGSGLKPIGEETGCLFPKD